MSNRETTMIVLQESCISDSVLLQYLEDAAFPIDSDPVLQHLEQCPKCMQRLALAAGDPLGRDVADQLERFPASEIVCESALPRSIGPYAVFRRICRGGMCEVFECGHPRFERRVAVKQLLETRLTEDFSKRFAREAQLHSRLNHHGIVTLYEYGEFNSRPYLVMELVQGKSLAIHLKESPLPSKLAAEMTMALAEALDYAHRNGVIHRDLKPGNVVIPWNDGDSGTSESPSPDFRHPRIIDFGLARMMGETSDLTSPSQLVGTPAYIAPERIDSGLAEETATTDIYSLGVILYESLVGRKPFYAEEPALTLHLIRTAEPVPPRLLVPGLSRDLETICLKCLEKNPDVRYADAADLAADLNRFLQGRPINACPVGPIGRLMRWYGRNRRLAASLAFSTLLLIGMAIGGVWFAMNEARLRFAAQQATAKAQASEARAIADRAQSRRLVREITTGLWEPVRILTYDLAKIREPGVATVRKSVSDTFQAIAGHVTGPAFTTEIEPAERIRLQYRLGTIVAQNGVTEAADNAFREVLNEFRKLPDESISSETAAYSINAANMLANDMISRGEDDQAGQVWIENCTRWLAAEPTLIDRLKSVLGPLDVLFQNYRIYLMNHVSRDEAEAMVAEYEAMRARIPGAKQPFPSLD